MIPFKFRFLASLAFLAVHFGNGVALAQVKVLSVKGRAFYNGLEVVGGQILNGGATLTTRGAGSYVDIEFPGGHTSRLREGILTLKEAAPKATVLALVQGRLFSVIKKLKGRSAYRVETAGAVAGVRGTKLFFEVDKKQSYVCVCEGRIDLKKSGAPEEGKGRLVQSGKEVFTPNGGDPGKTQPASKDKLETAEKEFKDLGFPVDKRQW